MKEAANFFLIAIALLVGCYVYVEAQGGFITSGQTTNICGPVDYHCIARRDATDNGIDPTLFERQINQESGFNPYAVSKAGAVGIAQIVHSTAIAWSVNPWNATDSLSAAAKAMSWYQNHYGSWEKALSAYNAGTATTDSAISRCGWLWKSCLPSETQHYIAAIGG
jgi:hypothetical protein